MNSLFLALIVASQSVPTPQLQPVSNLQYGHYDFEHGFTVTSGGSRTIGPDVLYDTIGNPAYYYGVFGSAEKQELLDSLQLPNRGLSGEEQVNGMSWNYCEGGYTAYFSAYLSLYTDTVACVGPSAWIPGVPSFADCFYRIDNLPGSGCWNVTIDLSGGFECTLPDLTNPASGAQGSIGWSVTPFNTNGSPYLGPFINAGPPPPGSQPTFDWRDWSGQYFGAYVHGGCFISGDFLVALYGSPIDVQSCFGSNSLDTLVFEATNAVENGAPFHFDVTGVGGSGRFYLLCQPDGVGGTDVCDQATMAGSGGAFTRQVALSGVRLHSLGVQGTDFSASMAVPANPVNSHVLFQVASFNLTGPIKPSNVIAASNGINTTL